ncbi:MAG: oxidoreductase, partial [Planctomycetes bacterium]|nr:oxidoreductase [Planctomycetota bacterium]
MKQLFVNKNGEIIIENIPAPVCQDNGVLVANVYSLISAETEKMSLEQKSESLLTKALKRPDLVKKVITKVGEEGLGQTLRFIKEREQQLSPLGYSSAGVILEVGKNVSHFTPGERVSCAGTGYANHAEIVYVPKNLITEIPG